MPIHTVIQQRRKQLNMTQEQLAAHLGITAPAVNKWEKGLTCPDISLLAPLARLLKIDLNTLLDFQEEPPDLAELCRRMDVEIQEKDIGAGFAFAREALRQYPRSEKLLHTLALHLQGRLSLAAPEPESKENYQQTLSQWFEQLTESADPPIRNSACYMLAAQALREDRIDRAQSFLDQLPNRRDTPDKRMMQSALYLRTSRPEEAAALLEQTLLSAVGELQMILLPLMEAQSALGDQASAVYTAQRFRSLAQAFDLSPYNAALVPFLAAAEAQNAEEALSHLRVMLEALSTTWTFGDSPLYRHIASQCRAVPMSQMIPPFLEHLRKDPKYAFLLAHPDFDALLRQYLPGE